MERTGKGMNMCVDVLHLDELAKKKKKKTDSGFAYAPLSGHE
jgi:hypothetical protein